MDERVARLRRARAGCERILSGPRERSSGERHAYPVLTGLRAVHPTREPRPPTADDIRALDEPFGTLLLELPLREPGYLLPTWDELSATVAAARERGARVHFDGARIWETTP